MTATTGPTDAQRRAVVERIVVPDVLDDLARRFIAAGHELALVGGSVRDALLGKPGGDLDLATDARPPQTLEVLHGWADRTWDVGAAFGTIGCRKGAVTFEITTYRSDTYDRASRKPAVSFGDSLDGDLVRRDFTVNAMALRLPDREFVDPNDGMRDLARRVLRTPSPAAVSFADDPLRMMRAARFSAQLGFDVHPDAIEAITVMTEGLSIVSAERIGDELTKLMIAPRPRRGLELLVDTGLADRVLPELPALRLEVDEHHRHKDVYEHTLTVLDQVIELESRLPGGGPDLVARLAAVMHDVGKPRTRTFEPGGGVSFHHHDVVGAKLTRKRLAALRYSGDVIDAVAGLVELHLRFHGYGEGNWTDSAVRRYVRDAGPLLDRLHILTRADCTTRNRRKAQTLRRAYDDLEERIARLAEEEELAAIRPDLDGNEVMELLGLPPGREVGQALAFLMEIRLERGPVGKEAAAAELLAWWKNRKTTDD